MQVKVARIGKPHGIRGEVTVQLFTDDPEGRFAAGTRLSIEPAHPAAVDGQLTVSRARWNKSVLVVGFEQIADRNAAETLRNHVLHAAPETGEDEDEGWYEHELLDLPVYAVTHPEQAKLEDRIGTVTGLQTMPTQDLLRIELTDGQEALIPFVEEIVPEVDLEQGFVVVMPPPGLLELNVDGAEEAEGEAAEAEAGSADAEGRG